ncbi:hypothetical protein EPUS_04845 [Endocarpon pusillum Z07020]|uniref:Uncharacterized protein n=1 Tax=Endocarpon pusillum (strain Z07020 / HMAS-L-300199) TaxID=1263415 RepID=U1GRQ0_ENDPU|nr:uncharacterized protein EPUS_04845 [Endocarpon pusillum Z07020]ERF75063.1 hypothetical protein EPUS_04845 [Endocarpon pusillum Z07020]
MYLSSFLIVTITPVNPLLGASDIPTLHATVQNTAQHPLTILTYNSLLDNAAGVLGIIHVTDTSTGEEVPSDVVQFQRVWPPPKDAFVEIAPDSQIEVDIPLRTHKLEAGKKYDVVAKWTWQGLWEGSVDAAMQVLSTGGTAAEAGNGATAEVKMDGVFEVKAEVKAP